MRSSGNLISGASWERQVRDLPSCIAAFKARRDFELNGK